MSDKDAGRSVSVVVPVKDGERYLEELLAALAREGVDEILVIDSGSKDGSVAISRAAGVEVVQIEPSAFGHGRTRNLGAERTSGDLICFLTQDATPCEGWLAAYREAFELAGDVGAAFGPHLARDDTSPMIARELEEFFAGFSGDGRPRLQRRGDPVFLSNVNACYSRECWRELRFRELPYSEDQAFGREMLQRGFAKVYHPGAAVLHAHDYGPIEFMRRYFDEYRGLRASIGHVESLDGRAAVGEIRTLVAGDRRWMAEHGYAASARAGWTLRSGLHHAGRKTFSALGSRSHRLPRSLRRRLSHERSDHAPEPLAAPQGAGLLSRQPTKVKEHGYAQIMRVLRDGPAPLAEPIPGMSRRDRLHVAFAIPSFGQGSGGHTIICQLILRLERRGHTCSIWIDDPFGHSRAQWPAVARARLREYFAPVAAPVYKDFDQWYGADVVVATGWQTVYPALALPGARARAYLVNDHEPEFYPTSIEARWAAETYRQGMHGICGSPWLRDLYVERYGGVADVFDYGVDHEVYRPRPTDRRRDTVAFYCRSSTPRRAVGLGVLALHELHKRRADLRVVTFGEARPLDMPFPYEHMGVAAPEQLSWLFSEATVGLCLSLTNYSLIPQEMLACGLPCVDLLGASAESVFGTDGPVELSPFDAVALADHMERMLRQRELWERRSRAGVEFVADRSWDRATDQVEAALRRALAERERTIAGDLAPAAQP